MKKKKLVLVKETLRHPEVAVASLVLASSLANVCTSTCDPECTQPTVTYCSSY